MYQQHVNCVFLIAVLVPGFGIGAGRGQKGPVADNGDCHVCHVNFATEELAVSHANANMGCVACHGFSQAHADDEENTTPPDRMWPKDGINKTCASECHGESNLKDVHEVPWDGAASSKELCTDCHGKHRIKNRTTRWDRKTGEVIE